MMFKNAYLSLKKSIGKSILLFIIMVVIANLIIAGLSIQSASQKSMAQIRSSLGNDVTLSVNVRNMMGNRDKGQSMKDIQSSITIEMAEQIVGLEYVESFNYNISTDAFSDTLTPVELESDTSLNNMQQRPGMDNGNMQFMSKGDFTIEANTTMANVEQFTSGDYELIEGRLLTESDANTNNAVIETNLALENDLSVGDTISVYRTVDDQTITSELTIVGIYEIISAQEFGGPMNSNPVNKIYTDLSIGQTLNNSTTDLTSATYYLDDPEHIDTFVENAKASTTIDFDTYTLETNDQLYQQNISTLQNTESFATMFLVIVIVAGSLILGLILILTMRSRFYEIGVFLSLGQSKLKIIGQHLIEIGVIAVLSLSLSLCTGKMVSNTISGMLESQSNTTSMKMEIPSGGQSPQEQGQQGGNKGGMRPDFSQALSAPENKELDVSLTTQTIAQLVLITFGICVVSTALPGLYILRLSPREILVKKEG